MSSEQVEPKLSIASPPSLPSSGMLRLRAELQHPELPQ